MGDLYKQAQWAGLQTIVRVVRTRHLWNKTTTEVMFYLSSLPPNAQQLGKAIRQHWSIENQLHWILDVTLRCDLGTRFPPNRERAPREGEDACRIRTGNGPENLAWLKRWSINLLSLETSFKRSTRQKRCSAAKGGFPHERLHQDGEASQHGSRVSAESSPRFDSLIL